MDNQIVLDRDSNIPAYRQIAAQLMKQMQEGRLQRNQQLPPERELAKRLEISRGTVKKAYDSLVHTGYAVAEQGAGTFVSDTAGLAAREEERARADVDGLIDKLACMGFDLNEIKTLMQVRLFHRQNRHTNIHIAAVDCNPETLAIIHKQLDYIEGIHYMGFLLPDVMEYSHPHEIFNDFDIIFTTATHFDELRKQIPQYDNQLVKAVIATDKRTIIKISGIQAPAETGVITRSRRFADIIRSNFALMPMELPEENYCLSGQLSEVDLKEFLSTKKTLILPPLYAMELTKTIFDALWDFNHKGGEVITFNYIIERGSLIYIEEKILDVRSGRRSL